MNGRAMDAVNPLQNPFRAVYEGAPDYYSVAMTAKNKVVIFNYRGEEYRDDAYGEAIMYVADSLEAANDMSQLPENLVSDVMKRQGIEIQELDI
jgi:hypothetical protein